MKLLTVLAILMISSAFASDFSSMTLKKDVELNRIRVGSGYSVGFIDASKGNARCSLDLAKETEIDTVVIPAGTVFQVSGNVFSHCGNDFGKYCSLSFSGTSSSDKSVSFNLLCKDEGFFASRITVKKINNIASEILVIE